MDRYKYKISDGTNTVGVIPYHKKDASITEQQVEGQVFYRKTIDGEFIFIGEAARWIIASGIETRFEVTAQKKETTTGTYADDWVGEFWKTDCKIDEDRNKVEVKIEIKDKYNLVLNGLNKEFNLVDILPETDTVECFLSPIIQVYLIDSPFVSNYQGTTYWETPVTPQSTTTQLENDWFFTSNTNPIIFVPGDVANAIDPDVSGVYIFTSGSRWDQPGAGLYYFDSGAVPFEQIKRKSDDFPVYTRSSGVVNGVEFIIMDSETTSSQIDLYVFRAWTRILTPIDYLSACETRPTSDFTPYSDSYPFIYSVVIDNFILSDLADSTPDKYRRRDDSKLNVADAFEYFHKPTNTATSDELYPVNSSGWLAASYWIYFDTALRTIQSDAVTTVTIKDCYRVESVINALLDQIDPSISLPVNEVNSQFYFGEENPIDTSRNYYLLIPKSNLLIGDYDQPAQVANIKLGDLLESLFYMHRVKWYINDDSEMVLEHVRFFRNGGHYVTPQIDIDISAYNEPATDKPWGYMQNKYTYEKQMLPEQIVTKWMDKGSYPFDGYPIEINSRFVEEGNIKEERIPIISTDIDFALSNTSAISTDGFFMVACSLASSVYTVKFKEVTVGDEVFDLQNGWLSLVYLHPTFFIDNMPSTDIDINGAAVVANSKERTKVQDVEFNAVFAPDAMQLITTLLGTGKIKSLKEVIDTGKKNLTVYHDTE